MKDEFKAGDLVFELTARGRVLLSSLSLMTTADDCVRTDLACYSVHGIHKRLNVVRLFHATPENRQALVTLYGEDAVPKLPLRGSELTRELLKRQKYVLCLVSHISDYKARSNNPPKVRTATGVGSDWFEFTEGFLADFAVPIDNNGNEITEIESC